MPMSIQRWEERSMAPRFNLFDPNFLPQNFLGGVAGNPNEEAPDPTSGYTPLLGPVILGGVGGSEPVRSDVAPSIADFYGGILNIGQPDAGYFDEFRLPGDDRVTATSQNLTVANPTDVTDTRAPFDPSVYNEFAQSLIGANRYDDTALRDQIKELQDQIANFATVDTSNFITSEDLPVYNTDDFLTADDLPTYDTSNFLTADDLPDYTPFNASQVDNYLSGVDFTNYVDPVDTSGFLTEDDLPDYTPFDSTQVDNYLSGVDFTNYVDPVDTSDFLTAQDLLNYNTTPSVTVEISGLPDTSEFLTADDLPSYDTSQFLTSADLPDYTPFDSNQVDNYLSEVDFSNYLDTVPTIDTSNFLTSADLPTQIDTSDFLTSADLPTQIDTSDFLTSADLPAQIDTSDFLTSADLPTYDTSNFLTAADLPTFDTSNFLTAADLPTFDTSQFLTSADLPASVDTSDFLTSSDLPAAIDTSQFLTAADLPSYDLSALQEEIAELRSQLNRNTASTPAQTQLSLAGILPIGF